MAELADVLITCVYADELPRQYGAVFGMDQPDRDTSCLVLGVWQGALRYSAATREDIVAAVHTNGVKELFLKCATRLSNRKHCYAQSLVQQGLHELRFGPVPPLTLTAPTLAEYCSEPEKGANSLLDVLVTVRERRALRPGCSLEQVAAQLRALAAEFKELLPLLVDPVARASAVCRIRTLRRR